MNLSGTVSAGYTDDSSNIGGSDHSIIGAGIGDFSGFYHDPNFLTFDIQPFYNQSRLNSAYQSLTAASGVSASAKIFGGSPFPGSISYSTAFNSSGNFGIPGIANYTTHGDNDMLGINWGVHYKNLPMLNLSFGDASSSYSVYGANSLGTLHTNTFSATSAYRVAGFSLNGGYQYAGNKIETPGFLSGEPSEQSNSGVSSYTFSVGHNLPWRGSFSAGASRSHISTDFGESSSSDDIDTTIDTVTAGIFFAPQAHLNLGGNAYYTDNLEGALYNTLLTAGAVSSETEEPETSRDFSLTGNANYEMPREHLILHAFLEHQQQSILGVAFASDSYNGTVTYSNRLLGGQFNGVLGLTRTSLNTSQQSLLGLNGSINYTHQIEHWIVSGALAYWQDSQTILAAYTESGFNYSGSVGRRLGRKSYWGAYGSGARSLLTDQPGTANSSRSFSSSLSVLRFSLNGSYSSSSGNALLTSTGLVATPIPVTAVPSSAVVLYNGNSCSFGLGSNPVRGLTFSATYAKALSATTSNALLSNNNTQNMFFVMTYQVRKLNIQAGYTRIDQGFSIAGNSPTNTGSFYVGISRWFNFF